MPANIWPAYGASYRYNINAKLDEITKTYTLDGSH